jgi:hypothetical protein
MSSVFLFADQRADLSLFVRRAVGKCFSLVGGGGFGGGVGGVGGRRLAGGGGGGGTVCGGGGRWRGQAEKDAGGERERDAQVWLLFTEC